MADKKQLKIDPITPDNDLDFDLEFDLDDMLAPEAGDPNSRSPVKETFTGVIGGVRKTLTDPSVLAKVSKEALPKEYGVALDRVNETVGMLSSLYDEATKELKPQLATIARKIDNLVPESSRTLKGISKRINELVGNVGGYSHSTSKEDQQNKDIELVLGGIFKAQEEKEEALREREQAKELIDERVEESRFDAKIRLLNSVDTNVSKLTQYNENINQAYQKKSLELQFRSYFALTEIAKVNARMFEVFQRQNESIVKNTGLPEYVKIEDSERFKDHMKSRVTGRLYDTASQIFSKGLNRVKERVRGKIGEYNNLLEQIATGLESLEGMNEQRLTMSEAGMHISTQSMMGEMIGSGLAEGQLEKLSPKIKELLKKHPNIVRQGYRLANIAQNPIGRLKGILDSDGFRNFEDSNTLTSAIGGLVRDVAEDFMVRDRGLDVSDNRGLGSLRDIAHFDNKVHRSITEIIPGYLSYILREIMGIRTGDPNTPVMTYDFNKGTFRDKDKILSEARKTLTDNIKNSRLSKEIDQTSALLGFENLDDLERGQLGRFLIDLAEINGLQYDTNTIIRTKAFDGLSRDMQSKVARRLNDFLNDEKYSDRNENLLLRRMEHIRGATPDIREDIESLVESGLGPDLEKMGVIKFSSSGRYTIDEAKYFEMVKEHGIGRSDINVKTNISEFETRSALDNIKKIPIFNWMYKKGKGDDIPHVGPMAQDVNKVLGDEAAPGGTTIDLINLNGQNMAAIQELAKRQESLEIGGQENRALLENINARLNTHIPGYSDVENHQQDTLSPSPMFEVVSSIKEDTAILASRGALGVSISNLIDKGKVGVNSYSELTGNVVKSVIDFASKASGDLFDSVTSIFTFGKDKVAKPTYDLITKSISNNKENISEAFKNLFSKGAELAGGALDLTKNLIFDKLPSGLGSIKDKVISATDWILDKIKGPMDLYIPGIETPVIRANLMRLGYYFDEVTGKVITHVDDLKNIKGNIVDKTGKVVVTIEEIADGLVNQHGEKIGSRLSNLTSLALGGAAWVGSKALSNIGRLGKGIFNLGDKAGKNIKDLFGKVGDWWSNTNLSDKFGFGFGFGNKEVINILQDIRDMISGEKESVLALAAGPTVVSAPTNTKRVESDQPQYTSTSSGVGFGSSILTGLGSLTKGAVDGYHGGEGIRGKIRGALSGSLKGLGSGLAEGESSDVIESLKSLLSKERQESEPAQEPVETKPVAVKKDRIDQQQERIDELRRTRQRNLAETSLDPQYRGENVIDRMMSMASNLISGLKNSVSALFDTALDGIDSLGGSKRGRSGKVARAGSRIAGGIAKGARVAGTAALVGGKAALGAGLTAGKFALGVGAKALGAITGVVSAPVLIGAAATVGVGYLTYKYFTRRKVGIFDKLRFLQYGLPQDKRLEKEQKMILALEEMLEKNALGFSGTRAVLNDSKIMADEVLSIFKINQDDHEKVQALGKWFEYRFKPVFLHYHTVVKETESLNSLTDMDKLKGESLNSLLDDLDISDIHYEINDSPFKALPYLPNTKLEVKSFIEFLKDKQVPSTQTLGKELLPALDPTNDESTKALESSIKESSEINQSKGIKDVVGKVASTLLLTSPVGMGMGMMGKAVSSMFSSLTEFVSLPAKIGSSLISTLGAGITKLKGWFSKSEITELQQIRLYQYGVGHTSGSKRHYTTLLELEKYLIDNAMSNTTGIPSIDSNKLDLSKILEIFNIDSKDTERVENMVMFFNERFKPFFLNAVAALYYVRPRLELTEIEELSVVEKLEFLDLVEFIDGPYQIIISPFKDMVSLNGDVRYAKNAIENYRTKLLKESGDVPLPVPLRDPNSVMEKKGNLDYTGVAEDYDDVHLSEGQRILNNVRSLNENTTNIEAPSEDGGMSFKRPTGPIQLDKADPGSGVSGGIPSKLISAGGPIADGHGGLQYLRFRNNSNIDTLNPVMKQLFLGMVQEYGEKTGKVVYINSGSRTQEEQAKLYRQNPKKAARPGRSLHEFGFALDVDTVTLNEMEKLGLMRKYGFTRPVGGETWHLEPAGIQVNIERAKTDPNFAMEAIKSGVYRGGGGLGTVKKTLGGRDAKLALSLLNANTEFTEQEREEFVSSLLDPKSTNFNTTKPETGSEKSAEVILESVQEQSGALDIAQVLGSSNKEQQQALGASLGTNDLESPDLGSGSGEGEIEGNINGDIKEQIAAYAREGGVKPTDAITMAALESGLNPNAKARTSSAAGLFQFINSTWKEMLGKYGKKYGLSPNTSPFDVRASTLMAAEYMKQNMNAIKSKRPNPSALDLYMAHFLGAGGARQFFSANPNQPAASILPAAAKSNKSIFFDGSRPRTIQEVYELMGKRMKKRAEEFGVTSLGNIGARLPKASNDPIMDDTTGTQGEFPVDTSSTSEAVTVSYRAEDYGTSSTGSGSVSSPSVSMASVFGTPDTLSDSGVPNINYESVSRSQGLNTLEEISKDSVAIQKEMLDVLKTIAENTKSNESSELTEVVSLLKDLISSTSSSTPTPQERGPLVNRGMNKSKSMIDLKRTA